MRILLIIGFVSFLCMVFVVSQFLSSGYFLARHAAEDCWWRVEVMKRVRGLFIPCAVLTLAFMVVMYALRWSTGALDFSLKQALKDAGLDFRTTPILAQLWYVRALLVLIFLSRPVMTFFRRSSYLFSLGYIFLLSLVVFFVRPFSDSGSSMLYYILNYGFSLEGLLYFSVGAFFCFHPMRIPSWLFGWCSLLLGSLLFMARAYCLIHIGCPDIGNRLGFFAIPLTLIGLFRVLPRVRIPVFLNGASYPVYLFHFIILSFIGGRFMHSAGGGLYTPDGAILHWVLRICIAFSGSLVLMVALRRFAPRTANWIFGGR